LPQGAEGQRASGTSAAVARHRCVEGRWTARLFVAGQDIESMQPLVVVAVLFALGEHKEGVVGEVDDRGRGDANLRMNVSGATLDICIGDGRCSRRGPMSRADHAGLPQGRAIRAAVAVGIEGVDRIMFVSNENDVVGRAVYGQIGHVQRLRIDLAIHGYTEKLAECVGVHIGRSENRLLGVLALMSVVVAPGEHVGYLRKQRSCRGHEQKTQEQ